MFHKNIFIYLLILSVLLTLSGCGKLFLTPPIYEGTEEGVIYISPDSTDIVPGEDCELELKVDSIENFKSYSISISYDPVFLSLRDVIEGTFLSSEGTTFFYESINNDAGNVLLDSSILGSSAAVSGEGTLATLTFTSLKKGSTNLTFTLVKMRDINNEEITTTKRSVVIKSK